MKLAAMGVVVGEDGSVLMIQRDDTRTWAPPGGSLDMGEMATEAVVREVEEETGYKVFPVRLVGLRYTPIGATGYLTFVFRCLLRGGAARVSAESLQVGFIPAHPIKVRMLRSHRQSVAAALQHRGGPPVWAKYEMRLIDHIGKVVLFNMLYPIRKVIGSITGRKHVMPDDWHTAAGTVIRNTDGAVLWVRRTDDGRWNLPHGGAEPNETPWETAIRETHEETGLTVALTDLTGIYARPENKEMIFVFSAEIISGELTTGPESAEFGYFQPGAEPENSLVLHVARVADAVSEQETTLFRVQHNPAPQM
jgi:8-oxo-dGTP pyrophosphatase MutT (NUDIX family)